MSPRHAIRPTTTIGANPPNTTAATGPKRRAATPDSNAPISLDDPMKIAFTAETRPSKLRGVSVCNRVERITTLTLSNTPENSSNATDNGKLRDNPKPLMHIP